MEKIKSFTVNHLNLKTGLYVSRRDNFSTTTITTFDMRFTAPNKEPCMDCASLHTLEHLGATYFRNCPFKDRVVYFGPMGCRTGFYLVLAGQDEPQDVLPQVKGMLEFVISFTGEIFGATPIECGNYSDQNLEGAKLYAKKYLDSLNNNLCTIYPKD